MLDNVVKILLIVANATKKQAKTTIISTMHFVLSTNRKDSN